MRKLLLAGAMLACFAGASAATYVDEIPGPVTLTASYEQYALECESGASWIFTLKNDGNGPQCKPGSGGVVTANSIGYVRKVDVTWGKKSNESLIVYGSHTPLESPLAITGEVLGTNGIGAVQADAGSDAEYDALGRRATDRTRGLVIGTRGKRIVR